MNNLDKQYQTLLQKILDYGIVKSDRTGTGTKSIFGYTIRHNMKEGFPLITTKKMPFRLIVTELLWFLRGDTNIKFLVDNDCNIWDGDAYQGYLKRVGDGLEPATKERFIEMIKNGEESRVDANGWKIGELGPIYGKQWRAFGGYNKVPSGWTHGSVTSFKEVAKCDQLANLIHDLKINPDSRRLMVTAWNPAELGQMTLPPCHYGFQVYTRELSEKERMNTLVQNEQRLIYEEVQSFKNVRKKKIKDCLDERNIPTRAISLMWNQRSVDTFLGLPFNIASYGLLLEIIAKEVNMVPDELIGNLGDTHLYLNHVEQAKEQIGRELSLDERKKLYENEFTPGMEVKNDEWLESKLATRKIPKRTREPYPLPKLKLDDWYSTQGDINNSTEVIMDCLMGLNHSHITLENYQSHPSIKAPLSN